MALKRVNPVPKRVGSDEEKQKILYIEDEEINWDVARLSLRERYSLTRATTSEEAFALLARQKYDLILMDIQLTGSELDGIEITRILRGLMDQSKIPVFAQKADCQGARIIFMTAYSARYSKDELLQAGGDDLITKPVDFTRLSLAMSRLLVREAFDNQPKLKKMLAEKRIEEKRSHVRVPLELSCKVLCDNMTFDGNLWDLSMGGARIVFDPGPVPIVITQGKRCVVQFTTAWGIFKSDIRIAWNQPTRPNELGVSFTDLSDENLSILNHWFDS